VAFEPFRADVWFVHGGCTFVGWFDNMGVSQIGWTCGLSQAGGGRVDL